ncbi:MAG: hypothetical protein LBH96_05465 [Candidatus Peribacteria bacterium]|nr:hypothetical protein [Candidatus Peribacteria bacterium]
MEHFDVLETKILSGDMERVGISGYFEISASFQKGKRNSCFSAFFSLSPSRYFTSFKMTSDCHCESDEAIVTIVSLEFSLVSCTGTSYEINGSSQNKISSAIAKHPCPTTLNISIPTRKLYKLFLYISLKIESKSFSFSL